VGQSLFKRESPSMALYPSSPDYSDEELRIKTFIATSEADMAN
jgi:hypothetical protein